MILCLCLCVPAFGRKVFPATRDSVPQENRYADAAGTQRIADERSLQVAVERRELVAVPVTVSPKLPTFRRYVRPSVAAFLLELDGRFAAATGRYLVVDSAVRPVDVQQRLARHNRNAAPANGARASSHERGTTFDLGKKTFVGEGFSRMRKSEYRLLLTWLAYYQAVGRIHVIEERACLHIMVREDDELSIISASGF